MTRFAVLSDIHGNVWALEAVLSHARSKGADRFINLGDTLYGPLAPRTTYERLQSENIITIRGNQDRQIYEATQDEIAANPTLQFILADLGPEPLTWMQDLPPVMSLTEGLFLCHGTPDDDLIYLLEDVSSGHPQVRSDTELSDNLQGISERMILCGHTHIPRVIQLNSGQLVVNPGSVGLPAYYDDHPVPHAMETFSPMASYCIIESFEAGWQVEYFKVPYDTDRAVSAALFREKKDWASALQTGRSVVG